jgi:amino acid adenylation domain-containing protein
MTTGPGGMSDGQRALFEQKLRAAGIELPSDVPAPAAYRPERVPPSHAQQRFLLLNELETNNPAYHMAGSARLSGALRADILRSSLEMLIDRHEVLRTVFPTQDGVTWQQVLAEAACPVPVSDLSALTEERRSLECERISKAEAEAPFDLMQGPLIRARLIKLADQEHVLLLTLHHIVADGWSVALIMREMATAYEALAQGRSPVLPPLRMQYADYTLWEYEQASNGVLDESLEYWRGQLAGLSPLRLPLDFARPAEKVYRAAHRSFRIDAGLAQRLRQFCRAEGASPFIGLLTGLKIVLGRHSGQDDVAVGSPLALRGHPDAEHLVGCFLNTVVLRTDLSGGPTFRQLLRRVRSTCLTGYEHARAPYERVISPLRADHGQGGTPLLSVMVNMLNVPEFSARIPGLSITLSEPADIGVMFDLSIFIHEEPGGYALTLQYDADLFRPDRIDDIALQWSMILEQGLAKPDRGTDAMTLVTPRAEELLSRLRFQRSPRLEREEAPRGGEEQCGARSGVPVTAGDGEATRLRLINRSGRPCGIGEVGRVQIWTSDPELESQGRHEAAAQSIAAARIAGATDPQIIATDDLGRYNSSGTVSFVGWTGQPSSASPVLLPVNGPESAEAPLRVRGPLPAELRVLADWNGSATTPHTDDNVIRLFEIQARRTPEAVAVSDERRQLTYAQLDARAHQIAAVLRDRGAGPERLVGICLHPGVNMVAAMLAVLKTGGGYVCLDPSLPTARLSLIVADARPVVIVTDEPNSAVTAGFEVPTLNLDADQDIIDSQTSVSGLTEVSGEQVAYVIYTSGSTGDPKGVVVEHRSLASHMGWMQRTFPLGAEDRILQKTPSGFDASIWEFYAPLSVGAHLVMARPGGHRDNDYLVNAIRAEEITVLQVVPSLLDVLLQTPSFDRCGSLRRVFCGGEALPPDLLNRFHQQSTAELTNLYGPTEACIDSTFWTSPGPGEPPVTVPIGRPVSNAQVHVLDARLGPVPIGMIGELYIGGVNLARGYLHRPDLTADRFVPNPFGRPGSRLYRTGDLARWRPDGVLEYHGRIDDQVKIRGHRVEIEEIRTAVTRHPGVMAAAVTARPQTGGIRLLAYYTPASVTPQSVRSHLVAHLPDHMVPAHLIPLSELPLTPNGKIDYKSLPAPSSVHRSSREPGTPEERLLATAWKELLGLEDLPGADANFFEVGGDSILAMKLIAKLRTSLHREIPVHRVFTHPTLAKLAEVLVPAPVDSGEVPLRRDMAVPPMTLSFTQQRLWMVDRQHTGRTDYHVPLAVRLSGTLDTATLHSALNSLAARHEILRTRYVLRNGVLQQIIDPPAELPLHDVESVADFWEGLAQQPFGLAAEWPIRVALLRENDTQHVLFAVMHHIASDGWSAGVLMRDLMELYRSARSGRASSLPTLQVRYADYAEWQRRSMTGMRREQQLGYWTSTLLGSTATSVARVPDRRQRWDRPGGSLPAHIGTAVRDGLAELAAQEGTTLFTVLYAGLAAVLSSATGQTDVTLGTDVAGRGLPEIQDVVGPFINQLVLRIDVSGAPTFRTLVKRASAVCRSAFTHQDVPYEEVAERMRDLPGDDSPLFEVKIAYEESSVPDRLEDLDLTFLRDPSPTVKSELTLFLKNNGEEIDGDLEFALDVLEEAQAQSLLEDYLALLRNAAEGPDRKINPDLFHRSDSAREVSVEHEDVPSQDRGRFKNVVPKSFSLAVPDAARTPTPHSRTLLPPLVEPARTGPDLGVWLSGNGKWIDERLDESGALLFRGFNITTSQEFSSIAREICGPLAAENGEHNSVSDGSHVQTPVFYAPDKKLLWHNENSFNTEWPKRIMFCSQQPAEEGGETLLVDTRAVYESLDPAIRRLFSERGVMYHRTYQPGVGLTWQQVFGTTSRTVAERSCRANGLRYQWLDGDRLHTSCVRPAVIEHRGSGRMSWFNQAQHWHTSCLDPKTRTALRAMYSEQEMPRSCSYGDGSPIPDAVVTEILEVFGSLETVFPWQLGDVLAVDNVACAHGRNPYRGKRVLLVAMDSKGRYTDEREAS